MRKFYAAAFFIVLAFSITASAVQDDWYKFTSPENRYSVLMPHQPTVEVVENSSGKGTHNRFSEVERGYAFVIEDFHDQGTVDAEEFLDGVRDGVVKELKGSLIAETKITTDGFPGRELKVLAETADKVPYYSRTRLFVVGISFYSMSFVYAKDMDAVIAEKIGERYFNSIKFSAAP
jgi:hypothetical protein